MSNDSERLHADLGALAPECRALNRQAPPNESEATSEHGEGETR
jgi:hypothetical protein